MHDSEIRHPDSRSKDAHAPSPAEQAIKFLTALRPPPWQLFAHDPDGNEGLPCTLVTTEEGIDRFVAAHDGRANLYYLLNEPRNPRLRKKPAKADMGRAIGLHVDIDRSKGETAEAAKARGWAALKGFPFKAHFVVDSGNCLQAIWMFVTPVDLTDPAMRVRVDIVNKALALRLDEGREGSEWNNDRILRLPGTKNLPNDTKRKNGFVPCRGRLAWCRPDLPGYALEDFEAELQPELAKIAVGGTTDRQAGRKRTAERGQPRASRQGSSRGDGERAERVSEARLDEVWAGLVPSLQTLIMHGYPEPVNRPDSDDTRSGAVFEGVRELHRLHLDAAIIEALYRRFPDGPAGKYLSPTDRLRHEIESIIAKLAHGQAKPDYSAYGWKSFKDIRPGKQEWLADLWVPRGELTAVIGPKTIGKTALLVEWSGRWTSGRGMPGFDGAAAEPNQRPARVLWLTHEERSDLLRHRLQLAGADLDLVGTLTHRADDDDVIGGAITDMLPQIEAALSEFDDWAAIKIEPITSFLQGVRSGKDEDVRDRLLLPLLKLARRFRLAVIYSIHMNKREDLSPLNRALNSVAFVNMPRSVIYMNKDPEDHGVVRFTGAGNWNRPSYAPGFTTRERRIFNVTRQGDKVVKKELIARVPVLVWEDDTKVLDADALMATSKPTAEKRENAIVWLLRLLDERPLSVNDIKRRAEAAKIGWRTVERAKKELHIMSDQNLFGWYWRLPHHGDLQPD